MLNANGVEAQASLFLVITCSAKSLPGTLVVLFVLERGQPAVLIAKEPAFVLCGWESLLYPSSDHCHKDTTTKAIRKLTELQPLMFFFLDFSREVHLTRLDNLYCFCI